MFSRQTNEFEETSIPLLESKDFAAEEDQHLNCEINNKQIGGTQRLATPTPLPWVQIVILSFTRLAEPIAYTQIFPYINNMVEGLHVTEKQSEVGYYSGFVDSIFAIFQLFTILQWGRLSDKIGRKPVIILGLVGVGFSTFLFGLSRTFWMAVLSRSLAGALTGNTAVILSVVAEITDDTNHGVAWPLITLSWSLGCTVGPIIGGSFANPVDNFPDTLGKIRLLRNYPYLLPCAITSLLAGVSIIIGLVFFKETLPSKHRRKGYKVLSKDCTRIEETQRQDDASIRAIWSSPSLKPILINYFLLCFLTTAFDVLFILLAYSPLKIGGLARAPGEIGFALAFSGLVGSCVQVLLFPVIQKWTDDAFLYRVLMLLWPVVFATLPILSCVARWTAAPEIITFSRPDADIVGSLEASKSLPTGPVLWCAIGVCLTILRLAHMCYPLTAIFIKNASPSSSVLGSTFGLGQATACLARSLAPTFVSTLFALSKKHDLLRGDLVWYIMLVTAFLGFWTALYIKGNPHK